jgi:hypothetical protein
LGGLAAAGVLVAAGGPAYKAWRQAEAKALYRRVRSQPPAHCYDAFTGKLNNALMGADAARGQDVDAYYRHVAATGDYPAIPFPIRYAPADKVFYVLQRFPAEHRAQVVTFDTACWGMLQGYVSTRCLHPAPPSAQQVAEDKRFWATKEADADYQRTKRITNRVRQSVYGCQCD